MSTHSIHFRREIKKKLLFGHPVLPGAFCQSLFIIRSNVPYEIFFVCQRLRSHNNCVCLNTVIGWSSWL